MYCLQFRTNSLSVRPDSSLSSQIGNDLLPLVTSPLVAVFRFLILSESLVAEWVPWLETREKVEFSIQRENLNQNLREPQI